jgi:hypothetical protein
LQTRTRTFRRFFDGCYAKYDSDLNATVSSHDLSNVPFISVRLSSAFCN